MQGDWRPDTLTDVIDRPILAAGAVVWRPVGDRLEVLVIHRRRHDDWSLPKGKLDPGEHLAAAAVREVLEETGVAVRLGPPVTAHEYEPRTDPGRTKRVAYWSAEPVDGTGVTAADYQPNDEVDEVRWLGLPAAAGALTYPRDVVVLERFEESVRANEHCSSPLVVLRHGSAQARAEWGRDDRDRPLTAEGRGQAEAVVRLLSAYGIDVVLSSDAERCVQTVRPFATEAGVEIDRDARWSEQAARQRDVTTAVAALRHSGRRLVLCTHRQLLPWVFEGLGVAPVALEPGAFQVLHRRKGELVSLEPPFA